MIYAAYSLFRPGCPSAGRAFPYRLINVDDNNDIIWSDGEHCDGNDADEKKCESETIRELSTAKRTVSLFLF